MSIVSDIAETMREGGRQQAAVIQNAAAARAQGQANSGQIWGSTLANIGQTIAGIPEQQARVADAQQRREMSTLQLSQLKEQQAANQQIPKLLAQFTIDGPDGNKIVDRSKLQSAFAQSNPPIPLKMQADVNDFLDGIDASTKKAYDAKIEAGADQADHLLKFGATPQAVQTMLHLNVANGLMAQDQADQIQQLSDQGKDVTPILEKIRSMSPKYTKQQPKFGTAAPGSTIFNEATGQITATTPKEAPPPTPFTLGPGQVRFGPNGEKLADVPAPAGGTAGFTLSPGETRYGPDGKPLASKAPRPTGGGAAGGQASQDASDVKESVKGMADGSIPPVLPSRASREYTALMAEAHRQGVNLVKLNEDWSATQKYLGTLNGAQQVRLRQAVNFTKESLPLVEDLAKEWDAGRFPLLNAANLKLAKNGAFGQKAASVATKLDAQIADLTSELGTVYKGGNSSTDESLALAAKNLSSNWSKQTLLDNITQIRKNMAIRENSIRLGAPVANEGNQYAPKTQTAPGRIYYDANGNPLKGKP